MSKSTITKNLRFELDYDTWRDFWDIGIKCFNLKTKNEILKKLIKMAKEKYPNES